MKKISKEELRRKILDVLNIAPYLWKEPIDVWKTVNYDENNPDYPLGAIKEIIEELKEESLLDIDEPWEWEKYAEKKK